MWNYSFIIPDLIILYTFAIYYFVHTRLPIKINYSFLRILFVNFFTIIFDVFASLAIENADKTNSFVIRALNAIYFALFFYRIFAFFIFTEDVLGIKRHGKSFVSIISCIFFAGFEVFAFLNFRFDLIFSISDSGKYSPAPFYNIIYVCAAFYIVFSFACIIYYHKKITRSALLALCSFNCSLLIGYIARIAFPMFLVMNLFSLLAIILIFISFENPIMYLAGKANAFNIKAFYAVFAELDENDSPLVLGFVINNYNELREVYSAKQMDRGISLVCQYFAKKYPKLLRFYLHDGRFVLIGRDNSQSETLKNEIAMRFKNSWTAGKDVDIFLEPKFVQIAPDVSFKTPEKIAKAVLSGLKEVEKLDKIGITINRETLITIEENILIKRAVERAVETNKVEMFLQPLMSTQNYKLVGAEALARIRDAGGNLIPPGKFIPIAEKNGRISVLGEQMFEQACKFIHDYDTESMGLSWINVNLSPIQFLRPDLNERFTAILEKYGVSAEKIHLEITEESMIDYALLKKQIQIMQGSGFQFVLDDYGSGYSNVSRLKRCPFVNIKLDMELVREYFKDLDTLLPAVVQALKQMKFTITAEGVESLEMVEAMKKIGCDYLQGFYFSKPLPADEFAKTYGNQ